MTKQEMLEYTDGLISELKEDMEQIKELRNITARSSDQNISATKIRLVELMVMEIIHRLSLIVSKVGYRDINGLPLFSSEPQEKALSKKPTKKK